MAGLISSYEPFTWHARDSLYESLLSCIVGQQLSTKAADTIWNRVKVLLKNDLSPENILKTEDQDMRDAGMSWAKIKYFNGVAEAHKNAQINEAAIRRMSDDAVIAELTKLKGIGRWSAEMILMFTLGRQDVFSLGDLGLRNAIAKLYKVNRDDLKKLEKISDKWRPYRTIAARYLWMSLDNVPTVNKPSKAKSQGKA